jgi:hypothetical protein
MLDIIIEWSPVTVAWLLLVVCLAVAVLDESEGTLPKKWTNHRVKYRYARRAQVYPINRPRVSHSAKRARIRGLNASGRETTRAAPIFSNGRRNSRCSRFTKYARRSRSRFASVSRSNSVRRDQKHLRGRVDLRCRATRLVIQRLGKR